MCACMCSTEGERLQGPCVRVPREKLRCVRENCVCPHTSVSLCSRRRQQCIGGRCILLAPCIPQAAPAWPPPLTPAASSTRSREPSSWEQPLQIHWGTHASSSGGHTSPSSSPGHTSWSLSSRGKPGGVGAGLEPGHQ